MYERKDAFYRRAKATGYRSRAAFKLLELARRHRLFRPGDRVIDLGAWPGSWLQVAAECTGASGRLIGIDLKPIDPLPYPGVHCLQGDIRDPHAPAAALALAGGRVDVLLSDCAPTLTGVRATDDARAAELAEATLAWAVRVLKPSGRLLMKVFTNAETPRLLALARRDFRTVRLTSTAATRRGSAELYMIAAERRAPDTVEA
jgi:23S rRNA (uridine2552-2'-O)-methyltransferase